MGILAASGVFAFFLLTAMFAPDEASAAGILDGDGEGLLGGVTAPSRRRGAGDRGPGSVTDPVDEALAPVTEPLDDAVDRSSARSNRRRGGRPWSPRRPRSRRRSPDRWPTSPLPSPQSTEPVVLAAAGVVAPVVDVAGPARRRPPLPSSSRSSHRSPRGRAGRRRRRRADRRAGRRTGRPGRRTRRRDARPGRRRHRDARGRGRGAGRRCGGARRAGRGRGRRGPQRARPVRGGDATPPAASAPVRGPAVAAAGGIARRDASR